MSPLAHPVHIPVTTAKCLYYPLQRKQNIRDRKKVPETFEPGA